eukprot:248364-Chlamydomonas_euryale.AAC.3
MCRIPAGVVQCGTAVQGGKCCRCEGMQIGPTGGTGAQEGVVQDIGKKPLWYASQGTCGQRLRKGSPTFPPHFSHARLPARAHFSCLPAHSFSSCWPARSLASIMPISQSF